MRPAIIVNDEPQGVADDIRAIAIIIYRFICGHSVGSVLDEQWLDLRHAQRCASRDLVAKKRAAIPEHVGPDIAAAEYMGLLGIKQVRCLWKAWTSCAVCQSV